MIFRQKPITIDAVCWDGTNMQEVLAFMAPTHPVYIAGFGVPDDIAGIRTAEGFQAISLGDWIMKDDDGSVHRVGPERFEAMYEPA